MGVVRQTETAAIKASGANKSAPFERRMTALYTSATLDAGERGEKAGEEGGVEASQVRSVILECICAVWVWCATFRVRV